MKHTLSSIVVISSIICLYMIVNLSFHSASAGEQSAFDCEDLDNDGWCAPEDCNDGDDSIHPGALEIPGNGVDENCDGSDAAICYVDSDSDGYGDPYYFMLSTDGDCDDPGEAYTGSDCDDSDDSIYPGAPEIPDDGIDQDCDGSDKTETTTEPSSWSLIKALYKL